MTARPSLAVQPATLGRRVGAYAIDLGVMYGIGAVLAGIAAGIIFAVGPGWDAPSLAVMILLSYAVIGIAMFVWWLIYSAMQGGRGSIGQRALGLRLQDAAQPAPIGFWRAVLRNIVFNLACSIVVGYFTPLFDSSGRRQGWHDLAVKAVVIDRRGTDAAAPASAPSPVATANPYLPPPVGAPSLPSAVAAPSGPPAPSFAAASFAPPAAPGRGPAPLVATEGMISQVPGVTQSPSAVRAPLAETVSGNTTTTPYPPSSTTEPLDALLAAAAAPAAPLAPAVSPHTTAVPAYAAPMTSAGRAPALADDDLDSTRLKAPAAPAAERAPLYPEAPVVAVLRWDDGTRMAVYGRTLYGRNPSNEEGAVAIAVRDETLSLSKTHFEIGGAPGAAWVTDRHSTNGTVLVRDGGRIPLVAGQQTVLRPGDRLEFGDRTATVGAA